MRNVARWLVFGAVLSACVEQPPERRGTPGVSQAEVEAVRRRVVTNTAPTPQHALNINYGNKVTLLGYDITPDTQTVRPGANVSITWYWRCDQPPGDGWRLFTHLDDANAPRENHDQDGDVRRAYQPERWRRGEFITDRQTFDVPEHWDSPVLKIYVGLWKGDERMHVERGQTSADGRALAITLNTGAAPPRVSEMLVPKAAGPITIDGQLNEPSWRAAGTTGMLVNPGNGAPASANDAHGSVRVLWDDQNLYLAWEVSDDNLVETGNTRDAHYWENDTTEVLIDPDGDGRNYYEIQVSPGNHIFDTQQPQPPSGGNFGNVAWNANIRSAVVTNGTVGNDGDTDTGYTVEMAIPLADINAGAAHTPPQVGDVWRVNFFLMDKPKNGGIRSAAWSAPRAPSFHTTDRFGRLTFRGPVMVPGVAGDGGAAPTAAAGDSGTPGTPMPFLPPGAAARLRMLPGAPGAQAAQPAAAPAHQGGAAAQH